ncbi:branched-chain amino acid aminotransferase [Bacillus sp. HMF5848]|uniref:branched-chain amino acid aminotransferase n=1 Tax=Bacillus sp. HMF5848 TaxID=2495421 RepID=UPI0021AD92AE|nr:branched-chain amino acid aminotransferase [Bacillus sp. HMF5848]
MLKKRLLTFIQNNSETTKNFQVPHEEFAFIMSHDLLDSEIQVEEINISRFSEAYIERGDKETENMLAIETPEFLQQPITYLKEHMSEFVYVESKWLDIIGVDAFSFELDDVFRTYSVLLGLRVPKKLESELKKQLTHNLHGSGISVFSLMYSQEDGLWELNFTFNNVDGFSENLTLEQAFSLIYQFIFTIQAGLESKD